MIPWIRVPETAVLAVRGLGVSFPSPDGMVRPVDDVSFSVAAATTLAILGESGCGKSMTALAIMGLVPGAGQRDGKILLDGEDLLKGGEARMRRVRGSRIGMIFQDPTAALNPVLTVGRQIGEVLRYHTGVSRATLRPRVVQLLRDVGITDPDRRHDAYPHELSGGMCQRVMIAMAIACAPAVLIADEPTTALDVTVQKQILGLLADLRRRAGTAILLITHDIGVVAECADQVAVMYAGRIVEEAPVGTLIEAAAHPYTRGLLQAMPVLEGEVDRFAAIPGTVPNPGDMPAGCRFATRCTLADGRCHAVDPGLGRLSPDHLVRCWYPQETA